MSELEVKLKALRAIVLSEIDETVLVASADALVEELRQLWKLDKSDFSADTIDAIKAQTQKIDHVRAFIEEQEEFAYLSTREDIDEVVDSLTLIAEHTEGMRVSKRVQKEIRGLLEKKKKLPSRAFKAQELKLESAKRKLMANAPKCKKCHSLMVLRGREGSFFWGCSRFPDCWHKQNLSSSESSWLG